MSAHAHLVAAPDPNADAYRKLGIDDADRGRLLHAFLSQLVGDRRGTRSETRNMLIALAAMTRDSYRHRDGSVEEAAVPEAPTAGFRNGGTVLSKLGLTPDELDRIWLTAKTNDGVHAVLPLDIVIAFFPSWAWRAADAMIGWGPGLTTEKLERFAQREALRPVNPSRARPEGGTVSRSTIDKLLSNAKGLMRTLVELRNRQYPAAELGVWVAVPHLSTAKDLGAVAANTDRSAPPLMLVRRALRAVHEDIEARRKTAEGRERLNRRLRLRLLIALLVVTGARILALSRVRVRDYERLHHFRDGTIGPAVRLYPGKRLSYAEPRWKALPQELAEWTEETIDYFRLGLDDSIWPSDKRPGEGMSRHALAQLLSGMVASPGRHGIRPALPRDDNPEIGYSPHAVRHLAEQLAFSVGHDYLEENPRQRTQITPQVTADALLDHAMKDDKLGYKDLNSIDGREQYARIAALGIWEYVRGDRGARRAPDRERIERAIAHRDEVRAEQTAVEARILVQREQRKAIETRANSTAALPVEALMRAVLGLSSISSALDDEYQEAADIQRRLTVSEQELRNAQTELVPIPDDAPDPEAIRAVLDEPNADDEDEPVRDWLLSKEAAVAFGVSDPTMRRWFRGELPHPEGDARNPWQPSEVDQVIETHSKRKRRLIVSRLNRSRIAPEVMRVINELLRHWPI